VVVDVVETSRMDEEFTPGFSLTLEGVTETVGAGPLKCDTVADSTIVPANTPMLVRVRFEKAAVPGFMTSWLGMGVTVKSRRGGPEDGVTAWPPGNVAVATLSVRTRRMRLETTREYFDLTKKNCSPTVPSIGVPPI
jgi:hypothetical protein